MDRRTVIMIELLILKIVIVCACIGWVYVEKLTANYGLLDFLPQYYPRPIDAVLYCSFCVAGWLSIAAVFVYYEQLKDVFFKALIITPFCTMAAVKALFYK